MLSPSVPSFQSWNHIFNFNLFPGLVICGVILQSDAGQCQRVQLRVSVVISWGNCRQSADSNVVRLWGSSAWMNLQKFQLAVDMTEIHLLAEGIYRSGCAEIKGCICLKEIFNMIFWLCFLWKPSLIHYHKLFRNPFPANLILLSV